MRREIKLKINVSKSDSLTGGTKVLATEKQIKCDRILVKINVRKIFSDLWYLGNDGILT